ncbi:dihydroorotate dehydrogenase electron transfer subunit [Desulfosarcina sp. OttesenSCG-928-G10]|nr:dihydroorotate dehydrogenase electron transfer subunit [Desulfosarcina sp. OttesenSCG-928-G10]
MSIHETTVLWNHVAAPGYHRLGLSCTSGFENARPGQFVMVEARADPSPLLRRPFSLLGVICEGCQVTGIEILFKVVGKGTLILSKVREGDRLSVIGPLGNGFSVPQDCRRLILVAGGVGVPPIRFLAHFLLRQNCLPDQCGIFVGGRSQPELVCLEEFNRPGMVLEISTDDGSHGHHGLVTRSLEKALDAGPADLICACGPMAMLKAVARLAMDRDIPCQVSLEAMMACGMGACLGCAVTPADTNRPYLHVCTDGPVFDARKVAW